MDIAYQLSQTDLFWCNRRCLWIHYSIFHQIYGVLTCWYFLDDSIAQKKYYSVDENFNRWCEGGSWLNAIICHNLHGSLFQDLFVTACRYRFYLMCGMNAHDKIHDITSYFKRYSDARSIPIDLNIDVLKLLGATVDFIDLLLYVLVSIICLCWRAYHNKYSRT